jgi:4,5-DOPA dioxygenase extradiol
MTRLPAIFVSHGAPTLLLETSPTRGFLSGLGATFGRPRAILCVSAHWDTTAPAVTATGAPETIHDFSGFPQELYKVRYPAPGDPELARRVAELLKSAGLECRLDPSRGLDHGAWAPLALACPRADVPVVQLSVQSRMDAAHHLAVGRALAGLRDEGVLILGSGGATHNLGEFGRYPLDAPPPAYVSSFETWLVDSIEEGRETALCDYVHEGPSAARNHPTSEHFMPLFAPMGAAGPGARGRAIHRAFNYGILSMAAFAWD